MRLSRMKSEMRTVISETMISVTMNTAPTAIASEIIG